MSIKEELESLTGAITTGDETYLAYLLLKDGNYKADILDPKYNYLLTDNEIRRRIERGVELSNAHYQENRNDTSEEVIGRPSLQRWLADRGITD